MNTEKLLDAIGGIDDAMVEAAGRGSGSARGGWRKWTAIAACAVAVIGLGTLGWRIFGGVGTSTAGGAGHDEGTVFMSYAGPVFPLTTLAEADGITAQRNITLDFQPWLEVGRDILVTDDYTLTNTTDRDQTLTLLYPFVSALSDVEEDRPTLTVDGEAVPTELIFGGYSGGFEGAWGAEDDSESLNLRELTSWQAYQALLSDGSYLAAALSEATVDLSTTPVVVYAFTDPVGPERTDSVPNPSIRVTFELDFDNTTVLTYGFHSGSWNRAEGTMGQGFSIPRENAVGSDEPYYLIVLGDDVENMRIAGYVTGGWDTEKELEWFDVTVERYETDLDTILRECAGYLCGDAEWVSEYSAEENFELYYALFREYLVSYGLLSEDGGADRYGSGWLEELSEGAHVQRVCYLRAEVTIPAGENLDVTAAMRKAGSFDYYCASSENRGVYGYDMVTRLGSSLGFTEQRATLEDRGIIRILRENFGFDLQAGVTSVILDPEQEHYYLEVVMLTE